MPDPVTTVIVAACGSQTGENCLVITSLVIIGYAVANLSHDRVDEAKVKRLEIKVDETQAVLNEGGLTDMSVTDLEFELGVGKKILDTAYKEGDLGLFYRVLYNGRDLFAAKFGGDPKPINDFLDEQAKKLANAIAQALATRPQPQPQSQPQPQPQKSSFEKLREFLGCMTTTTEVVHDIRGEQAQRNPFYEGVPQRPQESAAPSLPVLSLRGG